MAYKYVSLDLQVVHSDRNAQCRFLYMLNHLPRFQLNLNAWHEQAWFLLRHDQGVLC